jgi:hypothetical protein
MAEQENRVYLDNTNFEDPTQEYSRYEIGIDTEYGVIVYSECCAERMSDDVARKVHEALGRYLADRTGGQPSEPATEVWGVELTLDRARQVRQWRIDDNSWRGVAHEADKAWGTKHDGNQMYGRDLCNASARMLGEDPDAEPWN